MTSTPGAPADPQAAPPGPWARLAATARAARRTGGLVMIAGVVLLAFNLRPAVNALGVVLGDVQDATGISGTTAGLLAALPTLCFAVMGFAVSGLASRIGAARAVLLALVLLTVGQLVRSTGSVAALFIGSILALGSITVGNVLLPGLIRRYFPTAIGPMTAVYTTTLMIGQSLGAGLTLPIQGALGGTWRMGIGMWAVTSAIALVPWVAALLRKRDDAPASTAASAVTAPRIPLKALARSRHAWAMAVFFGTQSVQAYVVFGWVPVVLTDSGMTHDGAGGMLAIATAMGIPISAVVPTMLGTFKRHEAFVVVFVATLALGYLGLLVMPMTATWLMAVFIGIGLGSFPMALMTLALRARTANGTTALSGFAQSVGYLIATVGPIGFGFLHDLTGSFTASLIALLCTLVPMLLSGLIIVRPWKIEDDLPAATSSHES